MTALQPLPGVPPTYTPTFQWICHARPTRATYDMPAGELWRYHYVALHGVAELAPRGERMLLPRAGDVLSVTASRVDEYGSVELRRGKWLFPRALVTWCNTTSPPSIAYIRVQATPLGAWALSTKYDPYIQQILADREATVLGVLADLLDEERDGTDEPAHDAPERLDYSILCQRAKATRAAYTLYESLAYASTFERDADGDWMPTNFASDFAWSQAMKLFLPAFGGFDATQG